MIGYLEGTVRSGVVVTSTGVGYRVTTADILEDGSSVTLWVTTVVRENDLSLFGFPGQAEQAAFEAMVRVPRVGPQMALSVLRDVGVARLAQAVADRNPDLLVSAKGVGRKAAELIISTVNLPDGVADAAGDSDERELMTTLEALGFPSDDVREALCEVRTSGGGGVAEADLLAKVLDALNAKRPS